MHIKYLPYQPHCFAFGGFEIQILNNLEALSSIGMNVSKMDYWDRSAEFDIMHCWGLGFPHLENIDWGKKAGKKIVASILLYDYDTVAKRIKFKLSSYISVQRYLIAMLSKVDAVSVVNEFQADTCHRLYGVPKSKIWVIPNVVDEKYFMSRTAIKPIADLVSDYVLILGNVCARKNQYLLAEACIKANHQLLIIGKVMEGESVYGDKLQSLVDSNSKITWIKGLKENSNELLNYYCEAAMIALPSFVEQQPLSLLEGAIMGKPLLIADRKYAKQKLYSKACLVDPSSVDSIICGIQKVYANPHIYQQTAKEMEICRAANVAEQYKKLYQSLMQ